MATQVIVRREEPVVLVDLSYYIFHRFFATQRWYAFRNKKAVEEAAHLCETTEFVEAYKKHFLQDLEKFRKKLAKKTSNPIVFLRDCPRSMIWRHDHISDYKASRVVSTKMDIRIFHLTYEWLDSILCTGTPSIGYLCFVENLEADDLAYLFKKEIRYKNPHQEIVIISNDNDYFQLYDERCIIYNASLKNIRDRCKYGCPEKEKRLKVLLGDKSDNIKACISPKYKKQMEEILGWDDDTLQKFLHENGFMERFTLNKRLVDLSSIPESLQARFRDSYKLTLSQKMMDKS